MKRVIVLPEVRQYFKNLVPILYDLEYFSYLESSQKYVDELLDDIITNLPKHIHKPASAHFDRYGKNMDYAVFSKNKRTSWYVFFNSYEFENDVVYLIRYVGNNHTVAQYL
ncbi:MAG: hypothetical protein FWC94_06450 [Bacteroidales bacterium]|nr:hypothetical protein [Bacteroidales bacterium]